MSGLNFLRRCRAFGSGVGLEITGPAGSPTLRTALVKMRPGSRKVVATHQVVDFEHHAAGEWGSEFGALLRKHGMGHVAATVLLPRRDVIVRLLHLPGVEEKDLASAVGFQMEGLHPYSEEDAVSSWALLEQNGTVLVAITRRSLLDHYRALFSEAGIKIASFTCSAAVLYSARRVPGPAEPAEILACIESESGIEVYGESAARPVFSAVFDEQHDVDAQRALALAGGELRMAPQAAVHNFAALLNCGEEVPALAVAAGMDAACPGLALPVNLLPEEFREHNSRAVQIPAAVLLAAAVLLLAALAVLPGYQKQKRLETLNAEITKTTPAANRSADLDRRINSARQNALLLDEVRGRSKADMDVLRELTKILPPPTWLNSLELSRTQVSVSGETSQAAPLLGVVDASPLFERSEFTTAPARSQDGESFRIRTNRRLEPAVRVAQTDSNGAPAR